MVAKFSTRWSLTVARRRTPYNQWVFQSIMSKLSFLHHIVCASTTLTWSRRGDATANYDKGVLSAPKRLLRCLSNFAWEEYMHYPDTWATWGQDILSTSTILYINTIRGLFQLQNGCSDICQTLHGRSSYIILTPWFPQIKANRIIGLFQEFSRTFGSILRTAHH